MAVLALALVACATNPVTGERELMLMSEEGEREAGRKAAKQVEAQIGLVEREELAAYVRTLGERLAEHSPREGVEYRFHVADMGEPNAFALPGGWIYVSRGLLALASSEAELSNVIGHEIAHVAARHSAQRQTTSLGVQVLSVLGTVAAGAAGGAGAAEAASQLGQVAGAGLIASYGRDQERQADEVGQRMAAAAGYPPSAMADFLASLEAYTSFQSEGEARRPSFLDSHPMTAERVATTREYAGTLEVALQGPVAADRAAFLSRLEGLLVGPDPAEGLFRGGRFLHPALGFRMDFPEDWARQNGASAVAAQPSDGGAALVLQAQGEPQDPEAAARAFLEENPVEIGSRERLEIGGYPALRARGAAQTQQGAARVDLTWIRHPEATFRILGMAPQGSFGSYAETFRASATSFGPLDEAARESITEQRLRIVTARGGESLRALGERTGNAWSVEETAVMNGLEPDAALEAGRRVKIATESRYTPE